MAHWKSCPKHEPVDADRAESRAAFVARLTPMAGDTPPGSGSFRHPSSAGHSRPESALVHGVGKGWTVDGVRCTTEVDS
jgi:hypothetical protein